MASAARRPSYTSSADDGSTASGTASKRPKTSSRKSESFRTFAPVGALREGHKQALFGVRFNKLAALMPEPQVLFATVGAQRATIYECLPDGETKLLQVYSDEKPDEGFYTCDWTLDDASGEHILAVAGKLGIIHLLRVTKFRDAAVLQGHGSAINELQFHPRDFNLLLSASEDNTVRLWNIRTLVCVAVFGGERGHREQVLTAAFNDDGTRFVSAGMDHCLKVWNLEHPRLNERIRASYEMTPEMLAERVFDVYTGQAPEMSTSAIHRNYVDCVRWYGNLIFSKSTDNSITCWQPGGQIRLDLNEKQQQHMGDPVTILHRFRMTNCRVWYVRFCLNVDAQICVVGNIEGKLQVWDLAAQWTTKPTRILEHPKSSVTIRQVDLVRTPSTDIIVAVADNGSIWRWDRTRVDTNM